MTNADYIFVKTCRDIIDQPELNLQKTRACWVEEDGSKTPARTKHIFGVANRYLLSKGSEFPIMTLRQTYWKKALDEILWIYQTKSNNVKNLNSHIWDAWADEKGSIGKAYGYQCGKMYPQMDITLNEGGENSPVVYMDQVERAIYDLKHNPTSRRIMINMWNVEDLPEMNLVPCAYSLTLNVCNGKLNGLLNQRSQDMLTASNWNVVQYTFLMMMLGRAVGLPLGELIHVIGDCHIYDRHIPMVEQMLDSVSENTFRAPLMGDIIFNPDKTEFGTFTVDDFDIPNYEYMKRDFKIPVAV